MPQTHVQVRQTLDCTGSAECQKLRRVRARASYLLFRQLYDFLKAGPSVADVLRKLYDIFDGRRSFGSVQNAQYAAESLELVLRDNEEGSAKRMLLSRLPSTRRPAEGPAGRGGGRKP